MQMHLCAAHSVRPDRGSRPTGSCTDQTHHTCIMTGHRVWFKHEQRSTDCALRLSARKCAFLGGTMHSRNPVHFTKTSFSLQTWHPSNRRRHANQLAYRPHTTHPCSDSWARRPASICRHAASRGCPASCSSAGLTQQLMSPLYDDSCHSPPDVWLPMPGRRPCWDSHASTAEATA